MGPMTSGAKVTFRMATHSWMFWHPVSMETVLQYLERGESLAVGFDTALLHFLPECTSSKGYQRKQILDITKDNFNIQ